MPCSIVENHIFQYVTLKHLVEFVLQNTSYPKDNVFVVFYILWGNNYRDITFEMSVIKYWLVFKRRIVM